MLVVKNLVEEDLLLTAAVYEEDQQPFVNFHLVKERWVGVIFFDSACRGAIMVPRPATNGVNTTKVL